MTEATFTTPPGTASGTPTTPCRDEDPELFFPLGDAEGGVRGPLALRQLEQARAVCQDCPIRLACMGYALDHDMVGVWGATSTEERRSMRRARSRRLEAGSAQDRATTQVHRAVLRLEHAGVAEQRLQVARLRVAHPELSLRVRAARVGLTRNAYSCRLYRLMAEAAALPEPPPAPSCERLCSSDCCATPISG